MENNLQTTDNSAHFVPFARSAARQVWRAWPLFIIITIGSDASQRIGFDALWERTLCYQAADVRGGECPEGVLTILQAPGLYVLTMTLAVFVAYLFWRTIVHRTMPYRVLLSALAYAASATTLTVLATVSSPDLGIIAAFGSLYALRMLIPWWKAADRQMRESEPEDPFVGFGHET